MKEKKLLIPDIKGEANIVYDSGRFYPHHNLYYITSTEWDLRGGSGCRDGVKCRRNCKDKLKEAARRGDTEECNRVTFELYGLTADERAALSSVVALVVPPQTGLKMVEYSGLSPTKNIHLPVLLPRSSQ